MGPSRDDDPVDADVTDPVEAPAARLNWLAGLVRADALALAATGVLVITVVGLPFLSFLDNLFLFAAPFVTSQLGELWIFVPVLVGAVLATLLGLAALRQVPRQDVRGWVPAMAGATTIVGFLMAIGAVVTWMYAAESGLLDQLGRVFG